MAIVKLVPRYNVPRWVRVSWTAGVGALAALTGVALVLDRKVTDDSWSWVHDTDIQVTLVVALSAVTFVDAARRSFLRLGMGAINERKVEIRKNLATLIVTLHEVTNERIQDYGVSLYLLRAKRVPWGSQALVRLVRVRIVDNLNPSDVIFEPGKGVVGACWADQRETHKDLRQINARWVDKEISEEAWATFRDNVTDGFTLAEFKMVVGKYAEVLALPVMLDQKLVGVLSVDRRWNKALPNERLYLVDEGIKQAVGLHARLLEPLVK